MSAKIGQKDQNYILYVDSTFLTLPHVPGSLRIKIRNCLLLKNYFQRVAIVVQLLIPWRIFSQTFSDWYLSKDLVVVLPDLCKNQHSRMWADLKDSSFSYFCSKVKRNCIINSRATLTLIESKICVLFN